MVVSVERYLRKKYPKEKDSEMLYYIRQKPGDAKVVEIDRFCSGIQSATSLKKGDVRHVLEEFVNQLRDALTRGDKVKIAGLGTFHISIRSKGEVEKEDVTVRNIRRVCVRFVCDKALRLVNDANAETDSENNINFALFTPKKKKNGEPDDEDPIPDPKDDGGKDDGKPDPKPADDGKDDGKPDPKPADDGKDDGKGDDDDDNIPDPLS